jgi:murein L,D-transpeptidase YafK
MYVWHSWLAIGLGLPGNIGLAVAAPDAPTKEGMAPSAACPSSVAVLKLPDGIQAQDPRLNGKHLIIVTKKSRRVFRFQHGRLLHIDGNPACWLAGLGPEPTGHKQIEGDGKTPEGWYRTSDKPWSQWYAAIAVHYPNPSDAIGALRAKRITAATQSAIQAAIGADKKPPQTTAMGGEILLHGGGSSTDWTLGCIAMNNEDIDSLRTTLPKNMVTDVLILP